MRFFFFACSQGVIPVDDLRWLLKSLGDDLTPDEIEDMIMETDTDGSGTVDYEGKSASDRMDVCAIQGISINQ
jgi:Ca2+-binding EF-hand superfamily protein